MGRIILFALLIAFAKTANAAVKYQDSKILPGQNAAIGSFPFIASITFLDDTFICAGAIVSQTWILTSAECIYNHSASIPSPYYAHVGGIYLTSSEPGEQKIAVAQALYHPQFSPASQGSNKYDQRLDQNYYNNIGLLQLSLNIIWSSQVSAAVLAPESELILPGDTLVLAGWGGITDYNPVDQLQYSVNLHVMDRATCASTVPGSAFDEYHICTAPYPDTTPCKYDHGGPIFRFDATLGTVLLGVVNYSPCTDTTHPSVYASIPAHRRWLNATMVPGTN